MDAKLMTFCFLAVTVACTPAQSETTKTVVSSTSTNYDSTYTPNAPVTPPTGIPTLPMACYPIDTKSYNDLKKSIYSLNQGLGNVCFNAQAAFDYYSLYKNQAVAQSKLDEKLDKFNKAQKFLDDQYQNYQQALNAYKADLALQAVVYSDNVPINSALLL
ncbi:Hypothetical protein CINCED_3A017619 [Cinara cedri]|uniref:Uncharacterized protein n=1 Tax=Cinara cedri TaxID=506608 RepID=A0A5E4M4M3_9HEMI|nr:Hypothetical protein CINCED_3A017619 [Cinara cedri]